MEENEDMIDEYDRIKLRYSSSLSSLDLNVDSDEEDHFEQLDDFILFDRKIAVESKACDEYIWHKRNRNERMDKYDRIKRNLMQEMRYSSPLSSLDANVDSDEHFEQLDDVTFLDRRIENESKACEEIIRCKRNLIQEIKELSDNLEGSDVDIDAYATLESEGITEENDDVEEFHSLKRDLIQEIKELRCKCTKENKDLEEFNWHKRNLIREFKELCVNLEDISSYSGELIVPECVLDDNIKLGYELFTKSHCSKVLSTFLRLMEMLPSIARDMAKVSENMEKFGRKQRNFIQEIKEICTFLEDSDIDADYLDIAESECATEQYEELKEFHLLKNKLIQEIKELRDNFTRQQNEGMEKFNRLKRNLTKEYKELCDSIEASIADLSSGESGQNSYSGSDVEKECDESDSDVNSGNICYRV